MLAYYYHKSAKTISEEDAPDGFRTLAVLQSAFGDRSTTSAVGARSATAEKNVNRLAPPHGAGKAACAPKHQGSE
jgi:hypothetical protein